MPRQQKPLHALRLTMLRQAAGLTRHALAKRAGITPSNLTRIEEGADPHLSTLVRLAATLGCRLRDLVDPDDLVKTQESSLPSC